MTWTESLLTDEASKAERAVEGASAARWPLEWDLLRTLQNPTTIPADKLPILAWAMSVDIWDPAWPVETKRSVVRQAFRDHALKGTLAGIRRYLAIEGDTIVQWLAPPQGLYLGPVMSKEELEAWFQTMPQLRIRHRVRPISAPPPENLFLGADFMDADDLGLDIGPSIYGRQAFLFDGGVEIPLQHVEIVESLETRTEHRVERASVPGIIGESVLDHDYLDALFLDSTVLAPEFYTYDLDRSYVHSESALALDTVPPGLAPLSARYNSRSEIVDGGVSYFIGVDHLDAGRFLAPDEGEFLIFDLVYLHDPARAIPFVEATSFLDAARLGMPAFTFELMVDVPNALPLPTGVEGDFFDEMIFLPDDQTLYDRALDAVDLAKSYRDKGLVQFSTTRARRWGDGIPLDGSYQFGDRVPATL